MTLRFPVIKVATDSDLKRFTASHHTCDEFFLTNLLLCRMAWYEIPNTNAMSIYITILMGAGIVVFVFRLWLKATCGMFVSDVSSSICDCKIYSV